MIAAFKGGGRLRNATAQRNCAFASYPECSPYLGSDDEASSLLQPLMPSTSSPANEKTPGAAATHSITLTGQAPLAEAQPTLQWHTRCFCSERRCAVRIHTGGNMMRRTGDCLFHWSFALVLSMCGLITLVGCGASSNDTSSPSPGLGGHASTGPSVIDCSPHSSLGSCGPTSDNCYCPGSSCFHPSSGTYFCGFACSIDANCDFTALGVTYGACVNGQCYPKG